MVSTLGKIILNNKTMLNKIMFCCNSHSSMELQCFWNNGTYGVILFLNNSTYELRDRYKVMEEWRMNGKK